MRKLTTAIILATAGIVTTSAMAAPHDHNDMRHEHHAAYQDKKADWRPGQFAPKQYVSDRYKVDHGGYKKLHKPGRGQHWIKANGHYLLINDHNHKIIQVVR